MQHQPPRHRPRYWLIAVVAACALLALVRKFDFGGGQATKEVAHTDATKPALQADASGQLTPDATRLPAGGGSPGNALQAYLLAAPLPAGAPSPLAPRYDVPTKAEEARRYGQLTGLDPARLAELRAGDRIRLALFDGAEVVGVVNLAQREASGLVMIGGSLPGDTEGSFSLKAGPAGVSGVILPAAGELGYVIQAAATGGCIWLKNSSRPSCACRHRARCPRTPPPRPAAARPGRPCLRC